MKIRIQDNRIGEHTHTHTQLAIWIGREPDDFKIYAFNKGTSKHGRP